MKTQALIPFAFALGVNAQRASSTLPPIEGFPDAYTPLTIVSDYAALDLDLHTIRSELNKQLQGNFIVAQRVYMHGAFSRPVAELMLDDPLEVDLDEGTEIIGQTDGGETDDGDTFSVTRGFLLEDAEEGDEVLLVLYTIDADQDNYVDCMVGANPDPNFEGCFSESGTLSIPSKELSLDYSYDMATGNFNRRSFQMESLYSRDRLYDCENCPKPDFKKFVDYYGKYDYADHLVMSAFQYIRTDLQHGNHDFETLSNAGRQAVIEKGIVAVEMWMEVVSRMERSIDACLDEDELEDRSVTFWDSAVAFYTGSGSTPDKSGVFLFHHAEVRCPTAGTCGTDGAQANGTAWVNHAIMRNFNAGQAQVIERKCEAARKSKEEIVRLMLIPQVQGVLHYAELMDSDDDPDEDVLVRGAMHAAGVLPYVHDCSYEDARIIFNNLEISDDRATTDFDQLRDALARNLHCMELKCEEIGSVLGLEEDEKGYCDGSWAAASKNEQDDQQNQVTESITEEDNAPRRTGALWFYAFISLVVVTICFLGWRFKSSREYDTQRNPVVKATYNDESSAGMPPDAVNGIIEGSAYAPKYWQDCQKTDDDSTPNHSVDDNIAGEML